MLQHPPVQLNNSSHRKRQIATYYMIVALNGWGWSWPSCACAIAPPDSNPRNAPVVYMHAWTNCNAVRRSWKRNTTTCYALGVILKQQHKTCVNLDDVTPHRLVIIHSFSIQCSRPLPSLSGSYLTS